MGIEGSLVTVVLGFAAGIVMLVLAARRGHLLPSVRRQDRRADAVRMQVAPPQGAGPQVIPAPVVSR